MQNFAGYHFEPIWVDISADIQDEISDISDDIVTYLDNYYYFLLERSFYFILCSLWYCNDVFI